MEEKAKWVDELLEVFWVARMTPKNATRESPFFLIYGGEVALPSKIQEPTLYSKIMQEDKNNLRKEDLILVEEKRENSLIRIEAQKRIVQKQYNISMKHKNFNVGDWDLHKAFNNLKTI